MLELVVFTAMATLDVEFISTYIAPLRFIRLHCCSDCTVRTDYRQKFCKHEWFEKAMMAFWSRHGKHFNGIGSGTCG